MDEKVRFATDLFQGTAGFYDKYRTPYPEAMIADLVARAAVTGHGRLLDLACGTGQLAFPLRPWFSEIWAVDQEPDMVDAVRAKRDAADAAGAAAADVRPVVASAETLEAAPGYFELAVIGNAFHRLDRDLVARRIFGWLRPGGCLALCWSTGPWTGAEDWQRALAATVERWRAELGVEDRVPAGWEVPLRRRPDHQVLADAGFEGAGRPEFAVEHRWTQAELAGYVRSTSVLPDAALGERGAAFDADLAAALAPFADDGAFPQTVSFACEVARKPG